jgi:3-hydroxybutyryl-CoA dehydratase
MGGMNQHASGALPCLQPVSTTVDPAAIRAYAELTCDMNPIHLDAEFAAKTPMGGVIAHGTFSLNLILQSLRLTLGDARLKDLDLDVRFIRPVRPGDRLTAGGEQDAEAAGRYVVRVLNQHGEAVIEGTASLQV